MSSLKRSQKFCPNCKGINPIRTFFCKDCEYAFPQKEKCVGKDGSGIMKSFGNGNNEKKFDNKRIDDIFKKAATSKTTPSSNPSRNTTTTTEILNILFLFILLPR